VALLLTGAWMFTPLRPAGRAGIRPGSTPAAVPGRVTTWSS